MGGAFAVWIRKNPGRVTQAVSGRVSEGEPKFAEVVHRIRKSPGDTRLTKNPEGA